MTINADVLSRLLPAIYRLRDAELAASLPGLLTTAETGELAGLEALANPSETQQLRIDALRKKAARGPLDALLSIFADEFAVVEENLAQLYDDLFIETCADWAIPYIGDLVGYEPLHNLGRSKGLARAEVAHTIALRRRKGTAAVLEQLARDVTGWNARAVEAFQLLGTTQHMNHRRPRSFYAPDLRRWEPLSRIGSAFDSVAHTVDVRNVESGRGRFNIPNIAIFLWRLNAYSHTQSPAVKVDARRYVISPLGQPLLLYSKPMAEDKITHLADPVNVPDPLGRRLLAERKALYYGTRETSAAAVDNVDPSLVLYVDGNEVARGDLVVCHLGDDGAGWAHVPPPGKYAVDPVLGRVAVAKNLPVPKTVAATYHYGFSADLGGGEYPRQRLADAPEAMVLRVPQDKPTIQAALDALAVAGKPDMVVEIAGSGRYEEVLTVQVPADGHVTLRAAERSWPTLILKGEMVVTGGANSAFTLEGLRVAGARLRVPSADNSLSRLEIRHATLTPGIALDSKGAPASPGAPSLSVELAGVSTHVEWSILGALRVNADAALTACDSIIDANSPSNTAFAAPDGVSAGGTIALESCTLIGKLYADEINPSGNISNSLIFALAAPGDTIPPVRVTKRQSGCVRFSFLPFASLVPRRYRCQPETASDEIDAAPRFVSLRYGAAAYCQLSRSTSDAVRRGAEDESEMGAFHSLFPAQREVNLQYRLAEFLRIGLKAGIFYES